MLTCLDTRMKKVAVPFATGLLLCLAASLRPAPARADGTEPEPSGEKAAAQQPDQPLLEKIVRVVNPAGQPVVGAKVTPWAIQTVIGHGMWSQQGLGESKPPTLTTDGDGKVTIRFPRYVQSRERIAAEKLTCRVQHPDYAETSYNSVPVTKDALDKLATIVVHPGAQVEVAAVAEGRLLAMEQVYAMWSSPKLVDRKAMVVNAQGNLELPRLPAGDELLRLAFVPPDGRAMFSDVEQLRLQDGQRYKRLIEMTPAVRVEGKLDDSVPRPVTGGRVVAEIIDRPGQGGHTLQWRTYATIKDDGTFTLEPLPLGNLQVIALCDGFMAESGQPPSFVGANERRGNNVFSRPQLFELAADTNLITLQMTPTANCRVHVVDPEGQPVAGAQCSFWPNVGWWGGGSQIYCQPAYSTLDLLVDPEGVMARFWTDRGFSAKTDAAGVAIVKNLPTNERTFAVQHADWELPLGESRDRYAHVPLTAGKTSDVTLSVQRKGSEFIGEAGQ